MIDNLLLVLKGFIFGIANVIPGVSGGTLAISLGIYERLISVISHFRKNIKENIKFILLLGLGAVVAIALFSNIISFTLEKYPFATILFFIGFILGGMPVLFKKIKVKFELSNWLIFIITFGLVILMTFMSAGDKVNIIYGITFPNLAILFGCGLIAASTMILPGISGSFVLMLLGYYQTIINKIRDLTQFNNLFYNFVTLGVFGIGIIVGVVAMAKLIEWLLKKYEIKTYYGIVGFVLASIISIFIDAIVTSPNLIEVLVGIILLFIGTFISNKISVK